MRSATGGVEVVHAAGGSLRAVMNALVDEFPDLRSKLFDDQGALRHYLALFVDGVEVRWSEGLLAKVSEDAEIVIVPALGGG